MTIRDPLDEIAYMAQWRADHPGPWHQCPACRQWRLTTKPDGHCPLCPPTPKEARVERPWARRGGGDDQGHVPGPYANDH